MFTRSLYGTVLFKKSRVLLSGAVLYYRVYSVLSPLCSSEEHNLGIFNAKNLSCCQAERYFYSTMYDEYL